MPRDNLIRLWCLLPLGLLACGSSDSSTAAPAPPEEPAPPDAVPLLLVDHAGQRMPSSTEVNGLHAAFLDLDGDDRPDIAQPTMDGFRLLWNEGNTFKEASAAAIPASPNVDFTKQVIAADFDGDGSADMLLLDVLEEGASGLRLLTHASARSFVAKSIDIDPDVEPRCGVAADLDGDGDVDVVLTLTGEPSGPKDAPRALLLINDGTGKLTDQTSSRLVAPGLSAFGVAAGDLDGDGAVDLLFAGDSVGHRLLLNDGEGYLRDAPPDALPALEEPDGRMPALGDLDGDGALDIVVPSGKANQVLVNDGAGRFVDETPFVMGAEPGTGRVAVIVDLDRDTHADLVIGGIDSPLRILRNDGTGRLFDYSASVVPRGPSDSDAVSLDAADLDGDGDFDLFVSRTSLAKPWLLVNWYPEEVDDEDGDGVPDSMDNCPEDANPDQANRDVSHFNCVSGTDCRTRTGCSLAIRDGKAAYLLCEGPKTWDEARAFCKARGADLVVVESEEENEFLTASGLPATWIGLSDTETEGTFLWVDGDAPASAFWNADEPNDSGGAEDCAGIFTSGDSAGTWNDFDCSSERAFVCEDVIDRTPGDPGDACDVCPEVLDPTQKDTDDDGVGDACTPETP